MELVNNGNYFELFQLPPHFEVNMAELESRYLALLVKVHPDKAVNLSDAERRLSLQWATLTNEAYQTLKNPLQRAVYILKINNIDTNNESNTAMPTEFLLEQMEWREELQQAVILKNDVAIEAMADRIRSERGTLFESLGGLLEGAQELEAAAVIVRQLSFLEKLGRDIKDALTGMEN